MKKIRRWIKEEERYLWIVVILILFHSTFSLLGTWLAPLGKSEGVSIPKEEPIPEEKRLMKILQGDESLQLLFGFGTLLFILFFFIGLLWILQFLQKLRKGNLGVPWRPPDRQILWTLRDVFHVAVLLILSGYLMELFQLFLFSMSSWEGAESIRMLGTTLVTDFVAVCLIFYLVRVRKGQTLAHLGLSSDAFSRNFLFGLKGYTTLLPALFVSLLFSIWMAELFQLSPPPQPLYEIFTQKTPEKVFFISLLMIVFMGPVMEEIFFRGFLYNALKEQCGKRWAVAVSSVLFAVLHANLVGFLPITLLGCALAYGYELTGSLVTSMTIHILHNSLVMAFFLFTNHLSKLSGT